MSEPSLYSLLMDNVPPEHRSSASAVHQLVSSVTLTVGARSPTPLLYQWAFNGANIPNATNSSLVLSNVNGLSSGSYFVLLSNTAHSITSAPAILNVRTAPVVAQQPQAQITDFTSNAVFTVTAFGATPFTYQWLRNGVNIPGATSSAYTVTNVQYKRSEWKKPVPPPGSRPALKTSSRRCSISAAK